MSDDPKAGLQRDLDLLLSAYRNELGEKALAEALFATANGLVSTLRDQARYDPTNNRVDIPYADAARLEGHLEDLLSTRVVCVYVDREVPMHQNLEIRIVCGGEKVVMSGRAVQVTQAGTVFKLDPADVEVQRALISLPAVLRSNPAHALVIDQKSSRAPVFIDPEVARRELAGPGGRAQDEPEPMPTLEYRPDPDRSRAAGRPHHPTPRPASLQHEMREPQEPLEPPEPSEPSLAETTEGGHDKIAASRLAFQMPKVDGALARSGARSHFDFLNVHFSADLEMIEQARQELLTLVEQCRKDDLQGTAADRLDALESRLEQAWKVLKSTAARRKHRKEVVNEFQIETAIEMYTRQVEAAKMSRRYDVAIDCLRSIVELNPGDHDAHEQLGALRALDK